jgi:hypothetical protein
MDIPGVYFFASRQLANEPSDILYIGATRLLFNRIDGNYGWLARTYRCEGAFPASAGRPDLTLAKFHVDKDPDLTIAWHYVQVDEGATRLEKTIAVKTVQDELLGFYEDDHDRLRWLNRRGRRRVRMA